MGLPDCTEGGNCNMKVCVTPIETDIQNIDIDAGHENGRDVCGEINDLDNQKKVNSVADVVHSSLDNTSVGNKNLKLLFDVNRTSSTKHQLQSLLGLVLYIHKCVKPAGCFLNRPF